MFRVQNFNFYAPLCLPIITCINDDNVPIFERYVVQLLNIADVQIWAASLSRQPSVESEDGCADQVPVKCILCMPILNGKKDVIGVAQLINKVTRPDLIFFFFENIRFGRFKRFFLTPFKYEIGSNRNKRIRVGQHANYRGENNIRPIGTQCNRRVFYRYLRG